jgi:hypothetical protein
LCLNKETRKNKKREGIGQRVIISSPSFGDKMVPLSLSCCSVTKIQFFYNESIKKKQKKLYIYIIGNIRTKIISVR